MSWVLCCVMLCRVVGDDKKEIDRPLRLPRRRQRRSKGGTEQVSVDEVGECQQEKQRLRGKSATEAGTMGREGRSGLSSCDFTH